MRITAPTGHLDISFRQTVRIADNKDAHFMTPDLGAIPLYSVSEHPKLPAACSRKGDYSCHYTVNTQAYAPFAGKLTGQDESAMFIQFT